MNIILRHRDSSTKEFHANSTDIIEALKEIVEQTHEEDDTGYFFETKYADMDYLKKNGYPIFIDEYGVELSCEIVGINFKEKSEIFDSFDPRMKDEIKQRIAIIQKASQCMYDAINEIFGVIREYGYKINKPIEDIIYDTQYITCTVDMMVDKILECIDTQN